MTRAPAAGSPALTADRLTKRYSGATRLALQEITLSINPGSLVALVGPNGAGKSTLIKCWLGFERPTSGSIRVHGLDPRQGRGRALNLVGHVPQHHGLFRSLSVSDHIAMAAALRPGFGVAFTRDRLRDIGLSGASIVRNLSGGQQAQLSLALALGTGAPILILDEPLASLDPLARREFVRLLVGVVRNEGKTAVLSSHVVGDVANACDRTIALVDGRIAVDLTVEQLLNEYRVVAGQEFDQSLDVVGFFPTLDGESVALVKNGMSVGRSASPDEVIMGYLASAGPSRPPAVS